jgi:NAD(P)H dehydrogenase (quinone)
MLAAQALMSRTAPTKIVLLSRTPETLSALAQRGAQIRRCDLDDAADLPRVFANVTTLLLISTNAIGRRVAQHEAAIRAARQAGVKRIVYTSFLGAEPRNPALVARDHCAAEQLLCESGLQWTILRNAQYAEAILDVIMPNALAAGEWRSAGGEGRIAPIARADCAKVAAAALLRPDLAGCTLNIVGSHLLTYRDMAAMIAAASGRPLEFMPVSEDGLYAMFDALGAPRSPADVAPGGFPWCSDDMVSFEAALREGWFDVQSGDAQMLMGRPPQAFADLLEDSLRARKETAA